MMEEMEGHGVLRRDGALESLNEEYRNQFLNQRENDLESESDSSVALATPYSGKSLVKSKKISSDELEMEMEMDIDTFYSEITENYVIKSSKINASKFAMIFILFICLLSTISIIAVLGTFPSISLNMEENSVFKSLSLSRISRKIRIEQSLKELPTSFSIFAPVSTKEKTVPVFFDLAGTKFSVALTKCLGLKEKKVRPQNNNKGQKVKPDFLSTKSLCYLSKNLDKKAKVFMLMRNPSTISAMSFLEKKDISSPQFDERTIGFDFSDYVQSHLMERDIFIRSILCKEEEEIITEEDFIAAKHFLEYYTIFSVYQDYKSLLHKIIEAFEWEDFLTEDQSQCVENIFLQETPVPGERTNFDLLKNANKFDFRLYSYALSSSLLN